MTKIDLMTEKYNRTHRENFMDQRNELCKRRIREKGLEME
jgi:hypothetical protein